MRAIRSESLAIAAVAVAVAVWSCSNVVIKLTSTNGPTTSFYRLWLAVPFLWASAASLPSIRRGLDRNWWRASLGGGCLFGMHQLLFFNSLKMTSVINVSIIGALQPVLVLLVAGPMFGETATLPSLLWSLLAVIGTALVVVGSAGAASWSPLGDTLAVLNLFAFTAYFLFSKRIRGRVGASQYVIGMTTVAAIVVGSAALATGQDLASPRATDWPIFLFLAIFPGTLGHFLTNWAHRHTSAFAMSIMLLAVPVLAAVGAHFVLGEALGALRIVGGVVVLFSIGMVIRSTRAETAEELAESAVETGAP
jgi:drug/metabolite transporter (DMT)-like permease